MTQELTPAGMARLQAVKRTISRQSSQGIKDTSAGKLELEKIKNELRQSSRRINASSSPQLDGQYILSPTKATALSSPTLSGHLKSSSTSINDIKEFQKVFYSEMNGSGVNGAPIEVVAQCLVTHKIYPDVDQATTFVRRMTGSKKKTVALVDIMNAVRSDNLLLQRKASVFVKSVVKDRSVSKGDDLSSMAESQSTSSTLPSVLSPSHSKNQTAKILISRMNSNQQLFLEHPVFSSAGGTMSGGPKKVPQRQDNVIRGTPIPQTRKS